MTTRRNLLLAATAVAATAMPLEPRLAQASDAMADFLFVQTASAMTFDKTTSKLTLEGIGTTTLFFSDRPERIAGNMDTKAFVPFWSKGKDSFLADPPNADLSILEAGKLQQVVVVLENPELVGNRLTYTVKVVGGEMPEKGSGVSVFIDIIGMPLTPLSYAGVARRGFRRAVLY
ncbi:hypothetical protein MRS76_11895 [Rhizobiaceae bacterium n13]|uniref:Uncharacterized protein n=1 Tax=Ferirhizobium litorale TaxID=2927786 RepID=A0AAE3QI73_9HYPH|nr:hypothetical protein [Fererhizobium litorale]MDI7862661.1 hypothetical protein [Fererhizobium litorale]MDI7923856.1 hypothetical protein [Fererhizobium litorale]